MSDIEKRLDELEARVNMVSAQLRELTETVSNMQAILKRVSDHVHVVSTDLLIQAQMMGFAFQEKFGMSEQEIKKFVVAARKRVESDKNAAMINRWFRLESAPDTKGRKR